MDSQRDLQAELMEIFQAELAEHLSTLSSGLLLLEQEPDNDQFEETVSELFRAAHSIKGAARAVGGLEDLGEMAHSMEDVLRALQADEIAVSPALVDGALSAVDLIEEAMKLRLVGSSLPPGKVSEIQMVLRRIAGGQTATLQEVENEGPAVVATLDGDPTIQEFAASSYRDVAVKEIDSRQGVSGDELIRIAAAKVDALLEEAGELLVSYLNAEQRLAELSEIQQRLTSFRRAARQVRPHASRLRRGITGGQASGELLEFISRSEEDLAVLERSATSLRDLFSADVMQLGAVAEGLQSKARRLRMLPIGTVLGICPRIVRDIARELGKSVQLEMTEGDTEVDRHVLERLKDPLIQLLRNAVGHGIEFSQNRAAAGKREQGLITISAEPRGNNVVIRVSDDGQGIDVEAIRNRATDRGIITTERAEELVDTQIVDLIFEPGISAAPKPTSLSGRGVGLDIVRRNLGELGGTISVHTQDGEGTTFELTVPLTLGTRFVLLATVGDQLLGLPAGFVEGVIRLSSDNVSSVEGRQAILWDDVPIPIVQLSQLLGLHSDCDLATGEDFLIVILSSASQRLAVIVDRISESRHVVVRNLGPLMTDVGIVAGATILGSGEIAVILNPVKLIEFALQTSPAALIVPAEHAEHTVHHGRAQTSILIVDDSITTRTLERTILEAAGYRVLVAADGVEGWKILRSETIDIVVSDVSMPRMDGIELLKKIRGETQFSELPVILLTSLDSEDDKLRGLDAGADAYLPKGAFDPEELLAQIEQRIGVES